MVTEVVTALVMEWEAWLGRVGGSVWCVVCGERFGC